MLTFGWGEILLVVVIIIVVVGPKELPNLIKQISSFSKSIRKLSKDFKKSLTEIADHEDFKEAKSTFNEVNKIKDDLDINNKFKTEIKTLKETSKIIEKEIQDINKIDRK